MNQWWNIILYTNGPHKYRVKKMRTGILTMPPHHRVWFVRHIWGEHETTVNRTKKTLMKKGHRVRTFAVPTPCGPGHCSGRHGPTFHNHRTLWTDRIAVGTYGRGGIKMVSDLIEGGEWA